MREAGRGERDIPESDRRSIVAIPPHQVLNRGGQGIGSPIDLLQGWGLGGQARAHKPPAPRISSSIRLREASGVPVPVCLLHADKSLGFLED